MKLLKGFLWKMLQKWTFAAPTLSVQNEWTGSKEDFF